MSPAEQFEAVVSEHYEVLFKFAMSLTRSECDAEDLTQQAFYIWAKKGDQLRDRSKVKTWLFTTLHRLFLAARRKGNRYSHYEVELVADELPPAPSPEPANWIDSSHALAALAKVDQIYQPAVALFYLDALSHQEIASVLGIPIGTVKSRLSRGLTQLRELLLPDQTPCEMVRAGGPQVPPRPRELLVEL
jgi:RNA polymerase sigma-70 factor (ECF subfamily)